jgi:hypothetical protein
MGKYFIFLFIDMALTKDERVEMILLCGRQGLTQRQVADKFNTVHPEQAPITHSTVCKQFAMCECVMGACLGCAVLNLSATCLCVSP